MSSLHSLYYIKPSQIDSVEYKHHKLKIKQKS